MQDVEEDDALSSPEACLATWPFVSSYAESIKGEHAKLARLQGGILRDSRNIDHILHHARAPDAACVVALLLLQEKLRSIALKSATLGWQSLLMHCCSLEGIEITDAQQLFKPSRCVDLLQDISRPLQGSSPHQPRCWRSGTSDVFWMTSP